MPKIPILTAETGPGRLQLPDPARYGVPHVDYGGEQITQFGVRLLEIDRHLQRQQDDSDLFRAVTDTEMVLNQHQLALTSDPDYASHSEKFLKQAQQTMQDRLKTLNSRVAAVYAPRAERLIATGAISVQTMAMKQRLAMLGADIIAQGERAAKLWITATPERKEELKNDWFAVVNRSAAFTPEQKNRKKAQWDEWTALEAIRMNPTAALVALSQDAFPELDPKQRETIMRSAEIAEARQERITKQGFKEEQEATKQTFVQKWTDDTLTVQEILASNLDATGEGSKEHYLRLMKSKESGAIVEDQRLKAEILNKIRTNKIISNEQIEQLYIDSAKKKRGIDWQSMLDLRKELTEMQTPDGRVLGHRKQEMFNGVKASIDKSIIGLKADPEGALLFLQYQEWVDAQLAAHKQSGKNPHDLLDPSNPAYLARPAAIAPFQRSLQDTMKDMAERFKRPNRAPLALGQQRQPGETVEQYLKRIK